VLEARYGCIAVSALQKTGLVELLKAAERMLWDEDDDSSPTLIDEDFVAQPI
jgi:hypothetical protein